MASAAKPTLPNQFLTFINRQRQPGRPVITSSADAVTFPGPTDCVLLAVSGGLDSVVMTHLFHNAGFRFAVAHVNFALRGNESDGDAAFVESLATHYGAPFHLTRFETDSFADRTGVSIQMAARTLRYDWFEQIRAQNGYACIATAHHRNDVLETLLLNLTRGTGLAGLHGIAVQQGRIIRPLLFADRLDLETYAIDHQLVWREDRSNADDYYARNQIRHHVVPVLQRINPSLLQTLSATIERLQAAETIVQYELERSASTVIKTVNEVTQINLISLRNLPEPAFRLAEWMRPFGFTYQQTTAIWQAIAHEPGQEFRSATHRVIHEQDRLTVVLLSSVNLPLADSIVLTELPEVPVSISRTHQLLFRLTTKTADYTPPVNPFIASLDADRLHFPLTIRNWKTGDRFRPLGLNGHKLISDLLADEKVPRLEREQTQMLLSGDQIAWVIGRRLDHRFRITAQTQRILQVEQIEI